MFLLLLYAEYYTFKSDALFIEWNDILYLCPSAFIKSDVMVIRRMDGGNVIWMPYQSNIGCNRVTPNLHADHISGSWSHWVCCLDVCVCVLWASHTS